MDGTERNQKCRPGTKIMWAGTSNIIYEMYRKQTSFGVVELSDLCGRILKSRVLVMLHGCICRLANTVKSHETEFPIGHS
jgi:hypothetical protein